MNTFSKTVKAIMMCPGVCGWKNRVHSFWQLRTPGPRDSSQAFNIVSSAKSESSKGP